MQGLVQTHSPCVTYWTSQRIKNSRFFLQSTDWGVNCLWARVPWWTGDWPGLWSSIWWNIFQILFACLKWPASVWSLHPCVVDLFPAGLSVTAVFSAAPSVQSWQMCSGTDMTRPNPEPWFEAFANGPSGVSLNPSFASLLSQTPHWQPTTSSTRPHRPLPSAERLAGHGPREELHSSILSPPAALIFIEIWFHRGRPGELLSCSSTEPGLYSHSALSTQKRGHGRDIKKRWRAHKIIRCNTAIVQDVSYLTNSTFTLSDDPCYFWATAEHSCSLLPSFSFSHFC